MAEDMEMKEVLRDVQKKVEEKFGMRPYMIIVTKADLFFANSDDKEKGKVTGTANYVYLSKPPMGKDSISKLLIDTARVAVNAAEGLYFTGRWDDARALRASLEARVLGTGWSYFAVHPIWPESGEFDRARDLLAV